ncbi:proteoglycan 4 isoform X2 [Pleuronectes platessa]|uniref:proteoglycan 4 isoform X2 n=1 Tax=Pleuronectes platessa TaxID=8262 RepID=UPI00232A1641|nr:proteoglycan 4 isoform X2 [Pleuronectes platessa]
MRQPLLLITLSLAVLLSADVLAQGLVQIQFQTDPVLVQTGTEIVFTVLTVPQVLSITWEYQGGLALGLWTGSAPVLNPVPQFLGRITITATQLRIGAAELRDAGNYTVLVIPSATTGQAQNSRSVQLRVFDPVAGVSLSVPSVAIEGKNVSLRCTWAAGTEVTVQWGKGGAAIPADSRITISAGSLDIRPARRGDAGEYTCTVSNPVSAQTATQSLTVYYGPDTPVVTKDTPKDCVGGGDVLVGQTVRLTCTSDSLPPAGFSWQRDGQGVASGQPDSGLLSLQTLSTDESGLYVCTAKNAITGGSSEKGTDLAVVETCLDGGEVAGIVIGCFLLILIIVLLIVLIVCVRRKRRDQLRQRDTVSVRTNPNPRPLPPEPQPIGARELGQDPPLHYANPLTRQPGRSYSALRETRGNLQTVPLNSLRNSDTHRHNGHTHTNGVQHNAIQNTNSYPHNGIDNPAFTHSDAQNANMLPNTQQQNSNILIQAGPSQGGNQQPAVQVSLSTLPQTAQHNGNAQMPTIHVNLNSYPTNGQQPQQDASLPFPNTTNNNTSQTQQNPSHAGQSNPRMQNGQSYPSDPRLNGHTEDSGHQAQRGLIPTGYTHLNNNNISRQNADTQTYEAEPARRGRSDRNPGRHDATPSSSRHQMPWDRERGTPSYPSSTLQRRQLPTEYTSDSTDSTTQPSIREARTENRSRPRPQSHGTSRSRGPTSQEAPSEDRRTRGRSADPQNVHSVAEFVALRLPQRSPRTQRERDPRDIRGSPASQIAPRQEATHSNSPQALPHTSQQASVGHSAMSQGPTAQRGLTAPQSADTRALADPNHLHQAHMSQQQRAAPIQSSPQGLGMQPVAHGANQPRQGGTAPVPHPTAQPNPTNLTQAALTAHTARAQTFQNRKQQTMAALLHPGPQTQAPAVQAHHAPIPPPVMPLAQFQTLPKERTQHRSPARGPQPPRPPVNIPVSQRHLEEQKRLDVQRRPAAHHHHHPGNGHVHASANRNAHPHAHTRGRGHPAHPTNPRQQQAHGGRPR